MAIFSLNADRGKTGSSNIFQHWKKRWATPFRFRECRCPIVVRSAIGLGEKKPPKFWPKNLTRKSKERILFSFFEKHDFKKWSTKKLASRLFFFFYKFQLQSVCCLCRCYFVCFETLEAEAQQFFWVERQRKVFFVRISFVFFPIGKPISQTSNEKKILNDLLQREKMLSFYWRHILLIQAHLYLRQQCNGSLFLDSILFPKPLWVTLDQFEKQVMVEIKLGSLGHEATGQTSRPTSGHGPLRPTCHKEYHQAF